MHAVSTNKAKTQTRISHLSMPLLVYSTLCNTIKCFPLQQEVVGSASFLIKRPLPVTLINTLVVSLTNPIR